MRAIEVGAVFKPQLSKAESKTDATTRAARIIIDSEEAKREAKTARLRAARLAQEEAEVKVEPAPKKTRKGAVKA